MASATDGTSGAAASLAQPRRALEELTWDETFVRELPADPCSDNIPRQVLHACYTKVSPSAPVENPKLVSWSTAVADILDLDHKEGLTGNSAQFMNSTDRSFSLQ